MEPKTSMSPSKGATIGTIAGAILGVAAVTLWKMHQVMQVPQDSQQVDTGNKTVTGDQIVTITGVGGADDGVKVTGYILPEKIDDIKFPLTVVVRPNKDLFIDFKAGDKLTFTKRINDDIIWVRTDGPATGDYAQWYPEFISKVLGAIV